MRTYAFLLAENPQPHHNYPWLFTEIMCYAEVASERKVLVGNQIDRGSSMDDTTTYFLL